MNDFDYENEIIEISDDNENSESNAETLTEEISETDDFKNVGAKSKKKKNKKSLKERWNDLTKKQKIIFIVASSLVLILIVSLILYFTIFKKDKVDAPKKEDVIVTKDNYRYENGKLIFLDKSDKEIGTYNCIIKDSEKCYVAKSNNQEDKFERIKSVYENDEELEKSSKIYLDNYVFVYDDNKTNLYDIKNKENILAVKSFKEYSTNKELVVVVDEDNKYGLIEISEDGFEYLIRPSYDKLGIVNNSLVYLLAEDKDKTYVIDSTGKKLSAIINTNVESVNKNFIVGSNNKSYNLYTYNYEEVASDYDYISLHDDVIAFVKGNKLYLQDTSLNKLHEEGIKLTSNDYVVKYIYDKDNKLVETKKAYEINVSGSSAAVTVGEDTKNINLNEGKVSANLEYMSYFDGKLYFYGDTEKTDVLGTYSCHNKNNLTSSTSTLANCNIYSNAQGMSGIYNNEFVFLYDYANKNDLKYYLYSLKEKKVKGTYTDLEIVKEDEINPNVKHLYTSSSYVIAKVATGENKGNYGVLEINSNKAAGKVGFKYTSIKKDKGYYLLINVDKSYSIYNLDFTKVSNEFDYIELFDKYYVGIKDNKLNVYAYNNALGIIESDISVTDNKFTIDFTNGFDITIGGTTYSYDVTGKVKEGV